MQKIIRVAQTVFGIPWLIFGVQHFMYADFVAGLVPGYFPFRLFWAYFTGMAMFAAGLSLITGIKACFAAVMLGIMLLGFILLIHIPKVVSDPSLQVWTRALEDIAISAAAFMLAGALFKQTEKISPRATLIKLSRYTFAALLIFFGALQFLNRDFLPSKAAPFLPLRTIVACVTGAAMVVVASRVFFVKWPMIAPIALGLWMLLMNLLLHLYLLVGAPYNPVFWTMAMLDLTITCGVFFLVAKPPYDSAV